jgi:hypothetical protein
MRFQSGKGYPKCVWDHRRRLRSNLDIAKEAQTSVGRYLVELVRAVLRVSEKKSKVSFFERPKRRRT